MKDTSLLVGTSKGLVVFEHKNGQWSITGTHFTGFPVSCLMADPRNGCWWAGLSHRHWGQKLMRSYDHGQNWEEIRRPSYPTEAKLSNGKPATLKKIWCMAEGGPDQPELIWMGTEPGGLFQSLDGGNTFELVEALWNHPSRIDPNQWFGAGRDHPFIHSIVVDPRDSQHVYIAVSCAGIFETHDGGQSWHPANKGLIAAYLPNPHVEIGHDPHLLLACQSQPDVLWQQNHCGVFRSVDAGQNWQSVSQPDLHVDYGFALAIDHQNPLRAWVIPVQGDTMRVAPDLSLRVAYTEDGGQSWQGLNRGLPQENTYDIVLRHSFVRWDSGMAFGTNNGNLHVSGNDGESWECISSNLAMVNYLALG